MPWPVAIVMKSILGGITGDTIGAQIELLEIVLLIELLWI